MLQAIELLVTTRRKLIEKGTRSILFRILRYDPATEMRELRVAKTGAMMICKTGP